MDARQARRMFFASFSISAVLWVIICLILFALFGCAHNRYIKTDSNQHARQCVLPVMVGISEGMPEELVDATRKSYPVLEHC